MEFRRDGVLVLLRRCRVANDLHRLGRLLVLAVAVLTMAHPDAVFVADAGREAGRRGVALAFVARVVNYNRNQVKHLRYILEVIWVLGQIR